MSRKKKTETPEAEPVVVPPPLSKWITIAVRLEPALAQQIRKLAHKAEITVSDWLRDAILAKVALTTTPGLQVTKKLRVAKEVPNAVEKAPF